MHQFVLINTRTIRAVLQFCAYNTRRAGARELGPRAGGGARGGRALSHSCTEPFWHNTHVPRLRTAFRTLSLRTFDRLDANAKIKLKCVQIFSVYSLAVAWKEGTGNLNKLSSCYVYVPPTAVSVDKNCTRISTRL